MSDCISFERLRIANRRKNCRKGDEEVIPSGKCENKLVKKMHSLETPIMYVFILVTHEPVVAWKGLKMEILTRENFEETNLL